MPKPVKRRRRKASGRPRKICFVIMPFGEWFDDYYEGVYKPAIENAGFQAVRADDIFRPGSIIQDIWKFTKKANVMLADLSQKNSNVFYELGLAHAINRPVILVTDNINDVPFDLRALRVIAYDKNEPDWGEQLRKAIGSAVKEISDDPQGAILATFLDVEKAAEKSQIPRKDRETIKLKQEIESLKMNVESMARNQRFNTDPRSARELIRYYVRMGLSSDAIIERVAHRGLPSAWVRQEVYRATHYPHEFESTVERYNPIPNISPKLVTSSKKNKRKRKKKKKRS